MPQRPYELQQLVQLIARQLAGEGRVLEWLLLPGRDGIPREVDTVLEIAGGPQSVRVALEYRADARPADRTWVEQLRGKYRDLPIARVVVVAKHGFTPAARAAAAEAQFRPLTLAEARNENWAGAFGTAVTAADDAGQGPNLGH